MWESYLFSVFLGDYSAVIWPWSAETKNIYVDIVFQQWFSNKHCLITALPPTLRSLKKIIDFLLPPMMLDLQSINS